MVKAESSVGTLVRTYRFDDLSLDRWRGLFAQEGYALYVGVLTFCFHEQRIKMDSKLEKEIINKELRLPKLFKDFAYLR